MEGCCNNNNNNNNNNVDKLNSFKVVHWPEKVVRKIAAVGGLRGGLPNAGGGRPAAFF